MTRKIRERAFIVIDTGADGSSWLPMVPTKRMRLDCGGVRRSFELDVVDRISAEGIAQYRFRPIRRCAKLKQ